VLVAVIVAAQVTREAFGYSFATWRFHLRGESIRSAADIGWMRDLTVGRMMREDVPTVDADTAIAVFREKFPLGSATQVVAVDHDRRYAGLVIVADAHAHELSEELSDQKTVRDLARHAEDMLLPSMTVREAVVAFDRAESEALAVVNSYVDREVMGSLTEAYALRRYSAALELRRRELLGDD
jgi:CIC family chloride channel protein